MLLEDFSLRTREMKSWPKQINAPQSCLTSKIPTEHELLSQHSVASLNCWMLKELEILERRFTTFVTSAATQDSLGR